MTGSAFDAILWERELKNEKTVAFVRLILALTGIIDILKYFNILSSDSPVSLMPVVISLVFFLYAAVVFIILLQKFHSKYLKYFVILFDYLYILLAFSFDAELTNNKSMVIWYALVGIIVFYFINLLRYSLISTIYTAILSIVIFLGISFYFQVDIMPIFIVLIIILFIGYSITWANRKMLVEANTKKMMERYLPPQLVGELYKKSVSLEPGGRNKQVTILFSDIRSFTSISESMGAAEVVAFLNDYLSTMTDIIFAHEGTIDKFMGDAIMTIFGAPVEAEDDALRAVQAAILMNKSLKEFNKKQKRLALPLRIGIGIHSGEVIAGNIGSDKRLDYTVIGDCVNLTSRIEGLTVYYNCPILISESTLKQLPEEKIGETFCLREVDNVVVKGKQHFVKIYEVMYFDSEDNKRIVMTTIEAFKRGLQLYRNRNFKEASRVFENIEHDKLSRLYLNRCTDFIKKPPAKSWDGTYIMETK